MKVLKNIVFILIGLIAVFLVVALFMPKEYNLDREIVIAKSADIVYSQVVDHQVRIKWSPWAAMDPNAKNTYEGTAGEVGSKWSWDGDPAKVGSGSAEIVNLVPGKLIEQKLVFLTPRAGVANESVSFEEVEGGTKTVWHFEKKLTYPVKRYVGAFLLDGMLGPVFEKGLESLKAQCEALPEEQADEVTAKEEGGA